MFDKLHTLEITAEERDVIETALHTQSKILNVQANAGGKEALADLNRVKRTLATVTQQTPCDVATGQRCKPTWFGMSGIFG